MYGDHKNELLTRKSATLYQRDELEIFYISNEGRKIIIQHGIIALYIFYFVTFILKTLAIQPVV